MPYTPTHPTMAPGGPVIDPDALDSGESNMPRRNAYSVTTCTLTSGQVKVAYFTATKTEAITKVAFGTGTVAAAATPTLIRCGIWTVSPAGVLLALVASTANDTTLLAIAQTEYEKALQAPFAKVAGQRYAAGLLVVTAATAPNMLGGGLGQGWLSAHNPMIFGMGTGLTDLPATLTIGGGTTAPYVEMRP